MDGNVYRNRRDEHREGRSVLGLCLVIFLTVLCPGALGTTEALAESRVALVIGNSRYASSPLVNPANDARAIGEALQRSHFDVTVKLDAPRDELMQAVQTYTEALARRQAVGVFYFAGHGLQLAWRNYMVPVDAKLQAAGEIPQQCVELGELLTGITKARNPLNLIILDACRDNPFGNLKGIIEFDDRFFDPLPESMLLKPTKKPASKK